MKKTFIDICTKMNYKISLQDQSLILKTSKKIKQNLAIFLSIVFVFIAIAISCNMVYRVEIYGLDNVTKEEVVKVLNDNGYNVGKTKSSYNLDKLEIILKENINKISFASSIIKGNTLLININEKIDNDNLIYDYKPLISPYDCIIKNINLKSGTSNVKNGDIVKKGDTIVFPYITYKDGTQLKVEAEAEIQAYIEISNTTVYYENHTELVRSGEKLQQTQFSLLGLNLGARGDKVLFSNYQIETKENYPYKNFFLPFKKTITYYYELVEKQVYIPFDKVVQNIIEKNQNLLYNNLQGNVTDKIEYETTTNLVENVYYVTTYLKTNIIF